MNSGLYASDPAVVAAFRTALIHQGIAALVIFLLASAAWAGARGRHTSIPGAGKAAALTAEPAGRRLLRIGFGLLWIFDGLLQAQPAMAAGLPSQVIAPSIRYFIPPPARTGGAPLWRPSTDSTNQRAMVSTCHAVDHHAQAGAPSDGVPFPRWRR